jgi:hypothetical protein
MNNTIQVRTEPVDPHTPVLAKDDYGHLRFQHYGEVGEPYKYILLSDAEDALEFEKPSTDADRMCLLEEGYTYCWYSSVGSVTGNRYRWVAVFSPNGQQLTDSSHCFETITEALDFVLDMEQA